MYNCLQVLTLHTYDVARNMVTSPVPDWYEYEMIASGKTSPSGVSKCRFPHCYRVRDFAKFLQISRFDAGDGLPSNICLRSVDL